MHSLSKYVFYSTLILYILTLLTVSYVGVYLTYVAIPVIVVSGLLMKMFSKKSSRSGAVSATVAKVFNDANTGLERFNENMYWYNEKNRIIGEKVEPYNERIQAIRAKMIEPEVKLKYETDPEKRKILAACLDSLEEGIREIESEKDQIKMAVEIDIAHKRSNG
ncbi:hypothetical protein EDF81_1023 [Enterobacter sp. BIGb0383]|uniref:hypothetical protein n=1 Tax=unclassified Enterobacter TaxID=2608935 RepID=UPI000F46A930|nr:MULTISPECIES: hypothetical protein [unclassified Enterobacter]ROP62529.1 hypothetical protein EDF81_1023 [Enterobacter sp. BIGb0383]ROS12690.1 hypothetical protein EC848_1026 [Enterobacter sp. BIGb0359]